MRDFAIKCLKKIISWLEKDAKINEYYDAHYAAMKKQPIEIAQEELTKEEFVGAMKFQVIKYRERAGMKDGEAYSKDKAKEHRYADWQKQAEEGKIINPRAK